jgi:hypothetical protein
MVIPCSGHMVPSCQPEVSLEMINTFIDPCPERRKYPTYNPPPIPVFPEEYPDEIEG